MASVNGPPHALNPWNRYRWIAEIAGSMKSSFLVGHSQRAQRSAACWASSLEIIGLWRSVQPPPSSLLLPHTWRAYTSRIP